jgi:pimeloyl-ACP methyl ester carboxylesterase
VYEELYVILTNITATVTGRIIEGAGLTNTPFKDLFPAYKGPPSEGLRVFGTVMFSVLQPRIEQMLVWLYPSNPGVVKTGLAGGILRDSQDPGASDVIAAGGKLPTPRPMNDLFREYTGPVLIAQGALDPLNDAKSRANIFADIRTGITVDLMPLGHCPMDENPAMVSVEYVLIPRI